MNAMKDANTGSCNMLRVVEEVASWPSIEAFEEEYRREQVLGSGRYDDNQSSILIINIISLVRMALVMVMIIMTMVMILIPGLVRFVLL